MQSCPKNVHTGPLIGSKTSKGPGQTNSHLIATHQNDADTNSTASLKLPSVPADSASCKASDTAHIFVKPEYNEDHRIDVLNASNASSQSGVNPTCGGIYLSGQKDHDKVGFAPLYYPNYSLNPKVLEKPEQPVSPARGSTGLPTSPTLQASASEENPSRPAQTTPASYPTAIGRRARVGKSMAREMMMQPHLPVPIKHVDPKAAFNIDKMDAMPVGRSFLSNETNENIPTALIKKEDVKKEREEVEVVSSPEKPEKVKTPIHFPTDCSSPSAGQAADSDSTATPEKRRKNTDEIINLEESSLDVMDPILKRQKILEIRQNSARISPKRSYKNLIKPAEHKPYLCKAQRKKLLPKNLKRLLKSNENADKRSTSNDATKKPKSKKFRGKPSLLGSRILNQSDADQSSSNQSLVSTETNYPKSKDVSVPLVNVPVKEIVAKEPISEKPTELHKPSDTGAGPELNDRSNKCASQKIPNHKPKSPIKSIASSDDRELNSSVAAKKPSKGTKEVPVVSATEHQPKPPTKSIPKLIYKEMDDEMDSDDDVLQAKMPRMSHPTKSKPKGSGKAKTTTTTKLSSETIVANNNNNSLLFDKNTCNNNNNNNNDVDLIENEMLLDGMSKTSKLAPTKRSKSRGSKFSNKKRHRIRSAPEITEPIMPRKIVAPPRWSNGWKWEGEPFHGKIFLNVSFIHRFSVRMAYRIESN